MMDSNTIRKKYLEFMKKNGHAIIENISLVPINDPSLLFVNSGMFPLVNYLMGEKHPQGTRLANFQRCIRTLDIEEVGDTTHHTLFEMIGNWSLGDYFKKEQLPWVMELYTKEFGLDPKKIYVSVFKGDDVAPKDEESIALWKKIYKKHGMDAEYTDDPFLVGQDNYRIFGFDNSENWWQRGEAPGEVGGPDSEIFFDRGVVTNPNHKGDVSLIDDSGRFVEIGNTVFIQYKLNEKLNWEELSQRNVDFGGGFERVVAIIQGVTDNYDTDLFQPIIKEIEQISGKKWKDPDVEDKAKRDAQDFNFRAIADHIRSSVFIIADGIIPDNKDQGYVLRRLIRRMIRKGRKLDIQDNFVRRLAGVVIERYSKTYPHIKENEGRILDELEREEIKFAKTLQKGIKELQKFTGLGVSIDGKAAFFLYETYGFPIEMILEELRSLEQNDSGDLTPKQEQNIIKQFKAEKEKHRKQSKAGAEKKFKGGLADHSETTTRLHTAHHLLLRALQEVLGENVHQRGSNITSERLRIDFSYGDKLTQEQLNKAEDIVNEKIRVGLKVEKKTMSFSEAENIGAEMEFGMKYGAKVNVYMITDPDTADVFSKECCGGPHVKNTRELSQSGKFRIIKQESVGSGIRRLKAVLA
ncbi:MAG: alanine--tRNA ligase [Candidatus Dojkabacteria bacterium]